MNQYLAIDIGGSAIKYAVIVIDGQAVRLETEGKTATPDTLNGLADAVAGLVGDCSGRRLEGIAVCLPGLIDRVKGTAVQGGALTYIKNCNIRNVLQGSLEIPLTVENDGKSAALGEFWMGRLQNVRNGVVMVLGTGIGGGIIADGKLLRGANLSAGEFSFIQTNNQGNVVTNTFASQNGVLLLIRRYGQMSGQAGIDGRQFFDRVEGGEKLANEMLQDYCRKIAYQIINLQNILDPERFVIGGGISSRRIVTDTIAAAVNGLWEEIVTENQSYFPKPIVLQSKLGNRANLYGALRSFLDFGNQPGSIS